ncbi:ABC transporter ATP-binding protein [Dolosigranulum pigrum]|uniref:ABC transporter ATP-binding protein n=1 Tax=Dolosigranulum pigrum TaxID=29394 RepID=UPI000DBF9182|nr:ABC transporter ATP-binding protein [Dolosigranulum pigrum]RAN60226.1 ABC transporter ATP-binding protein [Dolosigranulum pigrum]
MNKTKILDVNHLKKVYKQGKEPFVAVADVSMTIHEGEIVALIGPNGAGKTTTVSMIGGYLLPTSGDILLEGKSIIKTSSKHKPKIGVVFGGHSGFYGRATLVDNLSFFADLVRIPPKEHEQEVARVLKLVDLYDVREKEAHQLSTGMMQRLHIARAMLGNPSLLLLDEPTTGLDVEIAKEVRDTIKKLAQQGMAILLTSHIMSEIEVLADRIYLIGGGQIKHEGTVADILDLAKVTHIDRPATLEESYLSIAPTLKRGN